MGYRFHADERALVPRSLIAEALTDGALAPFLSAAGAGARFSTCAPASPALRSLPPTAGPVRPSLPATLAAALELAARNVALHEMSERVRLVDADLFAGLGRQRFDLILCNPPYVNAQSMAALAPEYQAEPRGALAGGDDGMDLVARIIAGAGASRARRVAGDRDRPRGRALRAPLPGTESA